MVGLPNQAAISTKKLRDVWGTYRPRAWFCLGMSAPRGSILCKLVSAVLGIVCIRVRGAAWLEGRILASHLGWQHEGNLVALVTPFKLCWPLSCLPYVDVWPGLSGAGLLWDVRQRVSGPRASVGFKKPSKARVGCAFWNRNCR